jgi:hypothetical protein
LDPGAERSKLATRNGCVIVFSSKVFTQCFFFVGHVFGLGHAGAVMAGGMFSEYLDTTSVMGTAIGHAIGNGRNWVVRRGLGAFERFRVGSLKESDIFSATLSSHTVQHIFLSSLSSPGSKGGMPRATRINLPDKNVIWLEWRLRNSLDADLMSLPVCGVAASGPLVNAVLVKSVVNSFDKKGGPPSSMLHAAVSKGQQATQIVIGRVKLSVQNLGMSIFDCFVSGLFDVWEGPLSNPCGGSQLMHIIVALDSSSLSKELVIPKSMSCSDLKRR